MIIFWIVAMNLVFSFDSMLAAMEMAKGNSWVMAVAKTAFYFVIGVLVLTDLVQSRYQKKLLAKKAGAGQTATAPEAS